ncbi:MULTISPECIES: DUF3961 domain-containing protein [Bacillus]|uniref:DUF3961 domain-containing protein n=3 Tax=Wbetavirus TaxID=1623308 RepID=A0A7U0M781_9CAUD|nr:MULTISPECIES: DUF3961 domain-containing protein [Bacillus cereus group]YP_010739523.1 hypothetical protein P9C59_gp25 [Bacillus phage Gamma]YP_010739631.1 hypothetical protein P9C71_gp27 [Bacillus phage F16Ba]YP_010739922.1 hypothetical protein P9C77_gp26 [Bacillus phage J5a]YP_338157.1 hypothetical protein P9C58_gp25 [Bacillus phage Cherry]YP_338208.1 DUF3961 domain-containing protein [Bacillus phage Gamma]EDX57973.1 conserved hypothetical protein [Bacillus cereus W]MRA70059.1 DUF3961 do
MNRVNDYFGLESKSDCIWFYGFFSISTILFLIDMIIALI